MPKKSLKILREELQISLESMEILMMTLTQAELENTFPKFQRLKAEILKMFHSIDEYQTFKNELHKSEYEFYQYHLSEMEQLRSSLLLKKKDRKSINFLDDTEAIAWAYQTLNSLPDDPFDVIKVNYRNLVRKNHPDQLLNERIDVEIARFAEERTQDINRAWQIIKKHNKI